MGQTRIELDEQSSEQVGASDPQDQPVANVLVILLLLVKQGGGACCLGAPAHACASRPELLGGPAAPQVVPVAPGGVAGTWGGWACPRDRVLRVDGGKLGGLEMESWHRGSVAETPRCASSASAPQRVRLGRGRQVAVVLHHLLRRVLLRLEEGRVKLGQNEAGELDDGGEGEGVGKDHGADLLLRARQVERHQGEPVDRVDAVGEEDEPGLVEAVRALAGLEGVEGGEDDEEEGEEEAGHEAALLNSRADEDPLHPQVDVQGLRWGDDQPDNIYPNLSMRQMRGERQRQRQRQCQIQRQIQRQRQ